MSAIVNRVSEFDVDSRTPQNLAAADSSRRYITKRRIIQENLKAKNYWPEGITHPNNYRKFYVAQDLSYCGFAQNESEIGKRRSDFIKYQVPIDQQVQEQPA